MEKRVLRYQLWDQTQCFDCMLQVSRGFPTCSVLWAEWEWQGLALMKTETFSRNICKVFWSQSWYQRTLFSFYAEANWKANTSIESNGKFYAHRPIVISFHHISSYNLVVTGPKTEKRVPWYNFEIGKPCQCFQRELAIAHCQNVVSKTGASSVHLKI